jgi:hypothetical protein
MTAGFARLSPTLAAILAAAFGISLSVFLVPGAGVQEAPTPLLTAIGGAVGRVAADLPPAVSPRASEPTRRAVSKAAPASPRPTLIGARQKASTRTHRAHVRHSAPAPRHAPSTSARTATPAATAPVAASPGNFRKSPASKARGHGHGLLRKRAADVPTAGAPARRAHGHDKTLGRSGEHRHKHRLSPGKAKKASAPLPAPTHELPPGQAKKAAAPAPAPAAPPTAAGAEKGNKGGNK